MFNLPEGIKVEEEIDVGDGAIQSFDHGVITTWVGRRKTPAGHRLVRAGRIVGWLAEPSKGKLLLGGKEARLRLEEIEGVVDRCLLTGSKVLFRFQNSVAALAGKLR